MNNLKYEFNTKSIDIIPISDVHLGDSSIDYTTLNRLIDYIKNTKDTYCVLNGDLFNQAIKASVSFEHGATNPYEEYHQAIKLFTPIKHKILMVTLGNHDDRILKETGVDLMQQFCDKLGIIERYVKYQGVLQVKVKAKKHNRYFRIFVSHGIGLGGGRTAGSKINGVKKLSEIVSNCDIYTMGHVHLPLFTSDKVFYVDDKHNNIKHLTRYYIISSAYLHYGGYGQRFNYPPSSIDLIKITLSTHINVSTFKVKEV